MNAIGVVSDWIEELRAEGIGGRGDESLDLDAGFAWSGVEAEEEESELFEDGEVMGGIVSAGAHLIVVEDDIHAPVEAILDMPVLSNGGGEARGIWREAGDIEASFGGGLALDGAGGFDHGEGFQAGPAFGAVQTVELVEGVSAAMFDAPVVFFERFVESVRCFFRGALKQGKEVAQGFAQVRLVVLHCQHVVGAAILDGRIRFFVCEAGKAILSREPFCCVWTEAGETTGKPVLSAPDTFM
jgi:hypothetical protein